MTPAERRARDPFGIERTNQALNAFGVKSIRPTAAKRCSCDNAVTYAELDGERRCLLCGREIVA